MLTGISGALLGPSFLERWVDSRPADRDIQADTLRHVHRWWRRVDRTLGPAASVRAIADVAAIPLFDALGYRVLRLEPLGTGLSGVLAKDERTHVALRIAPWRAHLDQEWRTTFRLGRVASARWAVVFSGDAVRLLDATRTWSRRAVQFDVAQVLRDERSLTAMLSLLHAAGAAEGETLAALVSRSERHGADTCAALAQGVLEALTAMFVELQATAARHRASDRAAFEQAVTVVYRLLFLLFAEARALVPVWHQVYREAFTIDALCSRALRQPTRRGLWKGVQAVARLAHHGCRAGDLIVTPFNGRLFSPAQTPLADRAQVSDVAVGRALISLATTASHGARERIPYGDLGVEQLGAVYERVLEYEPAPARGSTALVRTAIDRKTTGSFYTPRAVTDFLVRRALHPLVAGKRSDDILRLRVLDPAMGSGAFLVAACRYLADQAERALINEGALPPDCTRDERAGVRRLVAQRCLFGVDVNPMAVQLARLSLWLASLSADRPLTFLDHHLGTGDSLLGASLADLARPPGAARAAPASSPRLFDVDAAPAFAQVLPARFQLALDPDDTPSAVHRKERALAELGANDAPLTRWKRAADLWCAGWMMKVDRGVYHDVMDTLIGAGGALTAGQREAVLRHVRALAARHRFFHWELEFPEAFFSGDGRARPDRGFDAIVCNPPWDMLRADTGSRTQRDQARLEHRAQRRFVRDARVYRLQGGHTNRYQLFVERALQLLAPDGRMALIVPSGLATDQGCAALRRALFAGTRIDRLLGFDNRRGIFPIHRDVRFLLVTATNSRHTESVGCSLGLSDVQWLEQLPDEIAADPPAARQVTVSRASLAQWDPEHHALPWLTTAADLQLLSRISGAVPRLGAADGWQVRFGRELNASEDRQHFVARARGGATTPLLPVIEGKHLEPFRVDLKASALAIRPEVAAELVDRDVTFGRARLAYRDVASATNRLTLIAARLPAGVVTTHTVFCGKESLSADAQYCLLALLNSLIANYLVRLRVATHVTTAVMAALPVPRPPARSAEFKQLAALARTLEASGLAAGDGEYSRVNALAASLYGVTGEEYSHVVSTFPLLPESLRARCVAAYRQLAKMPAHAGGRASG